MDSAPPLVRQRRTFLKTAPLLAASLTLPLVPARAQAASGERWCATWGTAPAGPPPTATTQSFVNQTLRLIVRTSIGGSRLRVRFSNEMGSTTLRIAHATIAIRSSGASITPASLREITFGGQTAITIPAGAPALSDPVNLLTAAQTDLAISVYLPGSVAGTTIHDAALQSSYVSTAGDYTPTQALPIGRTIASWPFLTEVDIDGSASCVVALGDSITDGARSTVNTNRRWPDYLTRRLQASAGSGASIGVVNRGISANLLLNDYDTAWLAGHDSLERFDRDVLATAGARVLVALIGINDICYSNGSNPIPVADLVTGYRQLIARARARNLLIICATLPPFEGFVYYTAAREAVRSGVNTWLRTSGEFDGLLDTELALRDPTNWRRILPAYDSGDHLHPNDLGYQSIANAVPLGPLIGLSSLQENSFI